MGNKLLLADDSITIQKVVGIIFANEDYELTVVDNGTAALEKAKQSPPDIMLVDAVMPGMTGYEVCEQVRRTPALQHIPLLLMTGAFEPFDEDKAKKSGADEFISKPFESQALVEKVKTLVELGRTRGAAAPAAATVVTPPPPTPPQPEIAIDSWADVAEASTAAAATQVAPPTQPPVPPKATVETPVEAPVMEIIGGGADEDLWGTFDIEEVSGGEVVEFSEVVELGAAGSADQVEVEEAFSFAEEEETIPAPPPPVAEGPGQATQWGPVGEEAFDFGEEQNVFVEEKPVAATVSVVETQPEEEDISDFFALAEEQAAEAIPEVAEIAVATSTAAESVKQFIPEEKPVQVQPQKAVEKPVAATVASLPPPEPVIAPVSGALPTELSEAQLTALVAKISKDILEKIAWEVVPDLAESIIREEIRKIKEGS